MRKNKNFLHAAGKSQTKGTRQVISAFMNKPEQLILIGENLPVKSLTANMVGMGRISESSLIRFQNNCLFHICTSQYEGFGHYLHEGKSCGIVLTTNAAPMNEFIQDSDLLVEAVHSHRQHQAKMWTIDVADLRHKVKALMQLDNSALLHKLEYCKQSWVDNDRYFRNKIAELC